MASAAEAGESEYYHHSGSTRPNSSDEEEEENDEDEDNLDSNFYPNGPYFPPFDCGESLEAEGLLMRRMAQAGGGSDDEGGKEGEEEADAALSDPGLFRYNKRIFVTALPCLLLTLVMTGEMLLLIITIGGLVISLMTHVGEDLSKRCVVVFTLVFVPCHLLVVGTALPLLWLSAWNILLVGLINLFFILTGGWVIVQFVAFRKEEKDMCSLIEQMLFTVYPFVCCSLITWVLSTVVALPLVPFVFLCIWFVCLQLYLLPAESSFQDPDPDSEAEEADRSILPASMKLALVLLFVFSGPALHVVLTAASSNSSLSLFSIHSLTLLLMVACVGVFLSTLLGLRHLCEHLGLSDKPAVFGRWVSGAGVVLLCYPALQQAGVASHFLTSLPLAVTAFSALAFTLTFKRAKMLSLVLMGALMVLLCLWLMHLPWGLTYQLLGVMSLRAFYALVAGNFVLCVACIFAAWHASPHLFGWLLLLQAIALTLCELGLYQRGLYSLTVLEATGLGAVYCLHRLFLASKLPSPLAALTSAIHLTKAVAAALGFLAGKESEAVAAADYFTLFVFVAALMGLFVYRQQEEVTLKQACGHLALLMLSLAVTAQSFLLPIGGFLLQGTATLADLVGLWFGTGAGLVMLYALQHSQSEAALTQLCKASLVMGGVGGVIIVHQPAFTLTVWALYDWSEILSLLLIAALLALDVQLRFSQMVVVSYILGVCPGIHVALLVYGSEVTMIHCALLTVVTCCLLTFVVMVAKLQDVTHRTENFIKYSCLVLVGCVVAVLCADVISLDSRSSLWLYPGWRVAFGLVLLVAFALKTLSLRLGARLPMTRGENQVLPTLPVMGNTATVLAVVLAATQGPSDTLLHNLWCCSSTILLTTLQRDALLLKSLSPNNRATPTVLAAVALLVASTLLQSRLWGSGWAASVLGALEVLSVLSTLPLYVVLAGVLWCGQIWSEPAVVFTLPLNALVFLFATSYTAWLLALTGLVAGSALMMFKLPMLPYNFELTRR